MVGTPVVKQRDWTWAWALGITVGFWSLFWGAYHVGMVMEAAKIEQEQEQEQPGYSDTKAWYQGYLNGRQDERRAREAAWENR